MKFKKIHKTGYNVWLFGRSFWHRTLNGARKRSMGAQDYCNSKYNQIIEIKTGKVVY